MVNEMKKNMLKMNQKVRKCQQKSRNNKKKMKTLQRKYTISGGKQSPGMDLILA